LTGLNGRVLRVVGRAEERGGRVVQEREVLNKLRVARRFKDGWPMRAVQEATPSAQPSRYTPRRRHHRQAFGGSDPEGAARAWQLHCLEEMGNFKCARVPHCARIARVLGLGCLRAQLGLLLCG